MQPPRDKSGRNAQTEEDQDRMTMHSPVMRTKSGRPHWSKKLGVSLNSNSNFLIRIFNKPGNVSIT